MFKYRDVSTKKNLENVNDCVSALPDVSTQRFLDQMC